AWIVERLFCGYCAVIGSEKSKFLRAHDLKVSKSHQSCRGRTSPVMNSIARVAASTYALSPVIPPSSSRKSAEPAVSAFRSRNSGRGLRSESYQEGITPDFN